ncbi:hypothetical protein BJV78DRAFT_959546 [Lactifluus subvellereus]|nr:hypothetical protein BJV78DRAFT_959546 [Lactifluus subvellereus]
MNWPHFLPSFMGASRCRGLVGISPVLVLYTSLSHRLSLYTRATPASQSRTLSIVRNRNFPGPCLYTCVCCGIQMLTFKKNSQKKTEQRLVREAIRKGCRGPAMQGISSKRQDLSWGRRDGELTSRARVNPPGNIDIVPTCVLMSCMKLLGYWSGDAYEAHSGSGSRIPG